MTTMTTAYVRLELRRALRSKAFLSGLVIPIVMYVGIGKLDSSTAGDPDALLYVAVGLAAYGAVTTALLAGMAVVQDRTCGWVRQLHLTPMRPREVVLGRTVDGALVVLPSIVATCALAAVTGVHRDLGTWARLVGTLWACSLPFVLLGLAVGYRVGVALAQQVSMVLQLGLALLGGLWIPATSFPPTLRTISGYVPTNAMALLGRAVVFPGSESPGRALVVLLAWGLLFAGLAAGAYGASARRLAA